MLFIKNCLKVASSVTRGRLLATVAPCNTWTKRMWTDDTRNKITISTDFQKDFENDVNNLMAAYKTSNFETTLMSAPRHVFWTAVLSITPLTAKTLVAVLTLNVDDYAPIAIEYVSLYVAVANGWWLANGGGSRGCSVVTSSSTAPLSTSSFLCLQRAIAPSMLCMLSVIVLPQFFGVVSVFYAAFKMTCRLIANQPGAVTQPWSRSLVLFLYGLNAFFLSLALLCTVVC